MQQRSPAPPIAIVCRPWTWQVMKLLAASLVAFMVGATIAASVASAQEQFEFRLGFHRLAEQIPDIVGEPLENEHHNPANGDALQRTTRGLMVWRQAGNWTSFTDGHRTWIDGPFGIQERGNDERFKWEVATWDASTATSDDAARAGSVLDENLLVTWYGTPLTGLMGVLGQFSGDDLASRLRKQADAYAPFTDKKILPAYHLIAVVAQAGPGPDGLWRRRESSEVIDSMLEQARANGFALILDVQVGLSKVEDELEHLKPYLEQPDVYLALDPEFDMWPGQVPGQQIGHTIAAEINYAINFLEEIIGAKGLPPKVLIVHQFTMNMLPDKEKVRGSSVVDVVLDMDGFGPQSVKLGTYRAIMQQPLQFAGIKLFYDYDPGLFMPEDVMALDPVPSVVIYQ